MPHPLTHIVSQWMLYHFLRELKQPCNLHPPEIPTQMQFDIGQIARIAAAAYKTPIYLPWDIDRYCEQLTPKQPGSHKKKESHIEALYPPNNSSPYPLLAHPATIVDRHGNILVWYLPDAVLTSRQRQVWQTFSLLNPILKVSKGTADTSWRTTADLFQPKLTHSPKPGHVNLSPAWHHQGNEYTHPEVSVTLRVENSPGRKWIEETYEFSAICGGLLSIIHPQLADYGWEAIEKMLANPSTVKDHDNVTQALKFWTSPFSGISVISNRETPVHRDVNGRHPWYDILATFGQYSKGHLELPGLGYRLQYNPGTVVALAGKVVRHGVPRVQGNRVCMAYYMRNKVHEWLGVRSASWMNREIYQPVE